MTWHAIETLRGLYQVTDPGEAADFLDGFIADAADVWMPEEARSLAGTVKRWRDQILAWHTAKVTNGPVESMNNLIRNVANCRIRVLLYAGKPDWPQLATVTPR